MEPERSFGGKIVWTVGLANEIYTRFVAGETWEELAKAYDAGDSSSFAKAVKRYKTVLVDENMAKENLKLARKAQKATDTNRIERASFRSNIRVLNSIDAIAESLERNLATLSLEFKPPSPRLLEPSACKGIINITDTHFNQEVNISHNKFNFRVASSRLAQLARKARSVFSNAGVREVLVAMTGDLMNSDRRPDEMIAQETNRASAMFVAVDLLSQFLMDLRNDFLVTVASVSGNESRLGEKISWHKLCASDNYDFMLHNILSMLLSKGIKFIHADDPLRQIVPWGGYSFLLVHGNQFKGPLECAVRDEISKMALQGKKVDYVICGHKHVTYIGDYFARSGTLMGDCSYSEGQSKYFTRAAQNIFTVSKDDGIEGFRIDLQGNFGPGYDISGSMKKYVPERK